VESVADSNVYITHSMLILLYVDDLLVRSYLIVFLLLGGVFLLTARVFQHYLSAIKMEGQCIRSNNNSRINIR
jgi:hypothetical protein